MKDTHYFYGVHATPAGNLCVVIYNNAVVLAVFIEEAGAQVVLDAARTQWGSEKFVHDATKTKLFVNQFLTNPQQALEIPLLFSGTPFQKLVWQTVRAVPVGITVSYQQLASLVGNPKAVRAVARALALNTIALFVPCHRVIAKTGALHGYRWGVERKKALLAWEKEQAL